MKKTIAILMILSLMLSCAACSKEDSATPADPYLNIALTVGEYELNSVQIGYFFVDVVNEWFNEYGSYASYYGLDTTVALNRQICDSKTNETWAQFFLDMTIDNIQSTYALYHAAVEADYQLSEKERSDIEGMYSNFSSYASQAGFDSVDAYLQSMYGEGVSEESYKAHFEVTVLASSYFDHYAQTLLDSYTPEDLRAYEGDAPYGYDSYSYASYYLSAANFGSQKALYDAATALAAPEHTTVEALDAAIAKLDSAQQSDPTCTRSEDILYSDIEAPIQEWIRDEGRNVGDITAIAKTSDSSISADGYYIVLYLGKTDNYVTLANARHLLVAFEGGTIDSATGSMTYTDEEKAQAMDKARQLLEQWQQGSATDDSFGALADQNSADTTAGGLYEDIYPGEMFDAFNDWCFDESRQSGDTGIITSEYGCHIMYYVGDSEWTYRDHMVANDKLSQELEEWQTAIAEGLSPQRQDLIRVDMTQTVEDILY